MKSFLQAKVRRRDVFGAALAGATIATTVTAALDAAAAEPTGSTDKRKARYQANAPEVQNFYRVNRYPAR
jgi:D-arabinose 5-phosphate isomerase GutQ